MSNRKRGTLIGGIVLILLGLLLLLENLYHNFSITRFVLKFWPLILVYIGIKKGVLYFDRESKNFDKRSFAAVLIYLFLGFLFLFRNLSLISLGIREVRYYWPIIFIIMGFGKIIDYFANRNVKVKGSEVVFLIFVIFFGLSTTILFKVDKFVKNKWGNFDYLIKKEIDGENFRELKEKFKLKNEVSLKDIEKIKILAGDANLILKKNDDNRLKIEEKVKVYEGRGKGLSKISYVNEIKENGSTLIVKIPVVSNYYAKIFEKISIPENIKVEISSSDGSIRGKSISNEIKVVKSYGDISFNDARGNLEIKNFSGNINLKDIKGNVKVNIANGGVNIDGIYGELQLFENFSHVDVINVSGVSKISLNYGDASLSDLKSDLFLKSRNCNFNLNGLNGNLDLKSTFGDMNGSDINGNVSLDMRSGAITLSDVNGKIYGKANFLKVKIENVKNGISIKGANNDFWIKKILKSTFIENKFGSFYGEDCSGDVLVKEYGGKIKYSVSEDKMLNNVSLFSKNDSITLLIGKDVISNIFLTAELGKIFVPDEFSNKVYKKGTNMYFSLKKGNLNKKIECTTINGNIYLNWR